MNTDKKKSTGAKNSVFQVLEYLTNRITLLCQTEVFTVWKWDTLESPRLAESLWQDQLLPEALKTFIFSNLFSSKLLLPTDLQVCNIMLSFSSL